MSTKISSNLIKSIQESSYENNIETVRSTTRTNTELTIAGILLFASLLVAILF